MLHETLKHEEMFDLRQKKYIQFEFPSLYKFELYEQQFHPYLLWEFYWTCSYFIEYFIFNKSDFLYPKRKRSNEKHSFSIYDFDANCKSINDTISLDIDSIIIEHLHKYKLSYLYFLIQQESDLSSTIYSEYLKTYTNI